MTSITRSSPLSRPPSPLRCRAGAAVVGIAAVAAALCGCAGLPFVDGADSSSNTAGSTRNQADNAAIAAPAASTGSARTQAAGAPIVIGNAAASSAPAAAAGPARAPASDAGTGSVAGRARTFSTQLATYTAVNFDAMPGWRGDDFSASWPAFIDTCKVMVRRNAAWKDVCAAAARVDTKNDAAIRGFFEREFSAYQIRDDDRQPDGVVTGYFEPEIAGSRTYAPPYIYPVYGEPQDMLFLDARTLPPGNGTVAARVDGRRVIVQGGTLSTRDMGAGGLYALSLADITRDTLDRKVRLRAEGKRLQPYYTRAEIEAKGAPHAKVLAFVSSATALYEMQIQGSGRVRLEGGETIRLSYAEQNGQPFRPTLAKTKSGAPASKVRTRGGAIELELDDGEDDDVLADTSVIRVRGFTLARPIDSGAVAVPGQRTAGPIRGTGITDPSYVFFKVASSGADGPVGAFGVPLSAGRSIAVDPRSTPLGYPVYVATRNPGSGEPMQRLTIAQDTGGAIRGAVRADYFFGNGQEAATQARRMKARGQLWILLPRGQAVAQATARSVRTRGGPVGDDLPVCLVQEEDVCVDD